MRSRARDLDIRIGRFEPGKWNAITDVPGVEVGHATVKRGTDVQTGVTALWPARDVWQNRVRAGAFALNAAGELTGLSQIHEWGMIETPILLTNSHSVGSCAEAVIRYFHEKDPEIGRMQDVMLPIVGECDDSWLSDISGFHVKAKHVFQALDQARSGPVQEGNVGGGTGMQTCDFKSGIGTASRKLPRELGGYTLGALVMSNFGHMRDLRIDGLPIGRELEPQFAKIEKRSRTYGSIIAVLATDAPVFSDQLERIAKRGALGIGRFGSIGAHGSGEFVLAFSTANRVPRGSGRRTMRAEVLLGDCIDPLFAAAVETTEEAILNSMFMAQAARGRGGHITPEIPLEQVRMLCMRRGTSTR